jgi:hypothetical protein
MELSLLCGCEVGEFDGGAAAGWGSRAANGGSILSLNLLTLVPGCWGVCVWGWGRRRCGSYGGGDAGGQSNGSDERDDRLVEKHC